MCGVASRDRSRVLIVVAVVSGTLALAAIMVRTMTSLQQRMFGIDDVCAVVAYLFSASVTFGQVACGTLGFGKDTWNVSPENITLILQVGKLIPPRIRLWIADETGVDSLCISTSLAILRRLASANSASSSCSCASFRRKGRENSSGLG